MNAHIKLEQQQTMTTTALEWRFTGCANSEPLYYAYRDIINFTD